MVGWKSVLLGCFAVQVVVNLVFYGFPSIVFSVLIPDFLYWKIAWSLPVFIILYFLLAAFSLYYLGISPSLRRGKLSGYLYFAVGAVGSIGVLLKFTWGEEPIFQVAFFLWLLSSLLGVLALYLLEETIPEPISAAIIAFIGISAFVSATTAQWIIADYYVHVNANGSIPENATVIVAYPENVSPPNATG